MNELEELQNVSLTSEWKALCNHVLNDSRFRNGFGGAEHHHNFQGGLVVHTCEVLRNVVKMSYQCDDDTQTVLKVAAIWHDFMKVSDYAPDENGACVKQPYLKLINHVAGSFAAFYLKLSQTNYTYKPEMIERIAHCILSHHGRKEWGSPVEPRTAEAFVLHAADMMSAMGVNL